MVYQSSLRNSCRFDDQIHPPGINNARVEPGDVEGPIHPRLLSLGVIYDIAVCQMQRENATDLTSCFFRFMDRTDSGVIIPASVDRPKRVSSPTRTKNNSNAKFASVAESRFCNWGELLGIM